MRNAKNLVRVYIYIYGLKDNIKKSNIRIDRTYISF